MTAGPGRLGHGGAVKNTAYAGVTPSHGGAACNDMYAGVVPARGTFATSDVTYLDISPNQKVSGKPMYGTSVFRRGAGTMTNTAYVGATSGVIANGAYAAETDFETIVPLGANSELTNSHFYPTSGGETVQVQVAPPGLGMGHRKKADTRDRPMEPDYANMQPTEPMYAEAPLTATSGTHILDDEPTYADAVNTANDTNARANVDQDPIYTEARIPRRSTSPGVTEVAEESLYFEGRVTSDSTGSPYGVAMRFGESPTATGHYMASTPVYLDGQPSLGDPTYMKSAERGDDGEYIASGADSRRTSLAER